MNPMSCCKRFFRWWLPSGVAAAIANQSDEPHPAQANERHNRRGLGHGIEREQIGGGLNGRASAVVKPNLCPATVFPIDKLHRIKSGGELASTVT